MSEAPRLPPLSLAPRDAARIFVSGHSLTDQPLPSYLERVATSLQTSAQWNRQYIMGSSIRLRSRGDPTKDETWAGYRRGANRSSSGLDVVAEFREPKTVSGGPYDVLVIAEQPWLLHALVLDDTLGHLRDYHDRFIAGNPAGTTFLFHSWIDIEDKSHPQRWIDYERNACPIWDCVSTCLNLGLASESRKDRIVPLPAALALAELIQHLTRDEHVAAAGLPSARAVVDHYVDDNVHLTAAGSYYITLVVYSAIYQRPSMGAWAPPDMPAEEAEMLQRFASDFIARFYATYRVPEPSDCHAANSGAFLKTYLRYVRDVYWRRDLSTIHAYVRWVRHLLMWRRLFSDPNLNPLRPRSRLPSGAG